MRLNRIKSGPFHRFGTQYGSFFDSDHFLGRNAFDDLWIAKAPVNIRKTDHSYVLELAFPGFKRDDIVLAVENDMLMVEANKKSEPDSYLAQEMSDHFEPRLFKLSDDVVKSEIKAKFTDGILSIIMPIEKNSSQITSKMISVK